MRWNKVSIRTSIYNMLGLEVPSVVAKSPCKVDKQTHAVRVAMLNTLGDNGRAIHPNTYRKIRFASDIHGLWYCRSELMAVLADTEGEATAKKTLDAITSMFEGLLPSAFLSRNSLTSRR